MYPDLSYILHAIFGTEPDNWTSIVKTFGLFLVIAILTGAFFLNLELKRKELDGTLKPNKVTVKVGEGASIWEILNNAIFGFILGFKVPYIYQNFVAFQLDPAGLIFSAQGYWLVGFLLALAFGGFKFWEKNKDKLPEPTTQERLVMPHERIGDITVISAISGVVGAKVFAVLEDLPTFFADPIGTFFSGSGMAIYGGLIGAFGVGYFYLRRNNLSVLHVMDAAAPGLIIACGIGRMGCHFSGDGDWGIPNTAAIPDWWFLPDYWWAFSYPHNVLNEGNKIADCTWRYCSELAQPVWPTSIYEIFFLCGLGGILWMMRKRIKIPGLLFAIYLIFNGFERYWIEKIRVNDTYDYFGFNFTQAQYIAVIMMLLGVVASIVLIIRGKKDDGNGTVSVA